VIPRRLALLAGAAIATGALTPSFGFFRSIVAVLMFAGIWGLGMSYFRNVAPVDPDRVEDVRSQDLKYVCTLCGLEMKVEWDAVDKPPPRHCREPMKLMTEDGSPPLRSV
jgi:hypothetical protein